jgi:hypothetical protein
MRVRDRRPSLSHDGVDVVADGLLGDQRSAEISRFRQAARDQLGDSRVPVGTGGEKLGDRRAGDAVAAVPAVPESSGEGRGL